MTATPVQPQTLSTKELVKGLIFNNYAERKPEEGLCIWRMAHKSKKFTIVFTAEMRVRGAGFEQVLSPEFDYWDGYRVILPKGLIEWAEIPAGMPLSRSRYDHMVLEIVGVEHENCPFCKSQPKWGTSGGFIGATPISVPDFNLTCCKWFNGRNSSSDPVALAAARNAAITG